MNKIRLIIAREYFTRVKKRSFVLMTLLGPMLIVGMFMLIIYIGTNDDTKHVVAVYDEAGAYLPIELRSNPKKKITYVRTEQMEPYEFLEKPQFTEYVDVTARSINGNSVMMYYRDKPPGDKLRHDLEEQLAVGFWAMRLLKDSVDLNDSITADNRINTQAILDKYKKVKIVTHDAAADEEEDEKQEGGFVGMIFTVFIYMFIFIYGVQVMRGVIEEKTSRIVEVMISSVKPFQLMMGKIIGIAMVGLTQFAVWIILSVTFISVLSAYMPDMNPASVDSYGVSQELLNDPTAVAATQGDQFNDMYILLFEQINWPLMLSMFLFYFLFGYLLYGSLFAAVGSAVDSESDTQQFVLPISLPLVFGMYMGITLISAGNLESSTMSTLSMVPFTSPVVMPIRIAAGTFDVWELILSMAILVTTFIFFTWIAGRIYRIGILMYGKKASYKELFKWMFYR